MKSHRAWYHTVWYRLEQAMQHFGRVAPLTAEDNALLVRLLPPAGQDLFRTMSPVDQQHCLRVCRGLQVSGCSEEEMLAAALLHDVGKGQGRVPFWARPALVLGKYFFPTLLKRLLATPPTAEQQPGWRRALGNAWWHAEIGATLAADAGLGERAVLYIRTHHQPHGPAAALHIVDEVS